MTSMARRAFSTNVARGLTCLALPLPFQSSFAQAPVPAGLAMRLGTSMLTSFASSAGSETVQVFLGFLGLASNDMAQINARLTQISRQISALQRTLEEHAARMERALSQVAYDVSFQPVQGLIDTNATLIEMMSDLVEARSKGDLALRAVGASMNKLYDGAFLRGLETWHSSLLGAQGQTGLLKAWNMAAANQLAPMFGPVSNPGSVPRIIESQWRYFDTQQALTAHFLFAYYTLSNQAHQAQRVLERWLQNRGRQIRSLRGMVSTQDMFPDGYDRQAQQVTMGTTPLRFLPKDTMLVKTTQGWSMWYMKLSEFLPQPAFEVNSAALRGEAARDTGLSDWRLPSVGEFRLLVDSFPGSPRLEDRGYRFVEVLNKLGFVGVGKDSIIWLATGQIIPFTQTPVFNIAFNGQKIFTGGHDGKPTFLGQMLLTRTLGPDEITRYTYLS